MRSCGCACDATAVAVFKWEAQYMSFPAAAVLVSYHNLHRV